MPSAVHLSRPVFGDPPSALGRNPPRGRGFSLPSMAKTDNGVVDYFFFFFFAFFFVFAFAFRFFAIAALLSLSGWRHRYSAVANRPTLHSDYYSREKITVTLLNFVCKCR